MVLPTGHPMNRSDRIVLASEAKEISDWSRTWKEKVGDDEYQLTHGRRRVDDEIGQEMTREESESLMSKIGSKDRLPYTDW